MYTCRGLRRCVADKRGELVTKLDDLHAQVDVLDSEELRYPLKQKIKTLQDELTTLDGLSDEHDLGRAGCGYDLTAQITVIPDDGEEYEYRCPACGNTGTVRRACPASVASVVGKAEVAE